MKLDIVFFVENPENTLLTINFAWIVVQKTLPKETLLRIGFIVMDVVISIIEIKINIAE
jgi:hypothetical protein